MGYINYTPTRSLIGGSDGKLHPDFQRYQRAHKDLGTQKSSLNGANVESVYLGRIQMYEVRTDPIDLASWAKWEEFEHSVAGGETFTIDGTGTEASPGVPITVRLVPKSFRIQALGPRHQVYVFRVRKVA